MADAPIDVAKDAAPTIQMDTEGRLLCGCQEDIARLTKVIVVLGDVIESVTLQVEARNNQWDALMAQLESVWAVLRRVSQQSAQVCSTEEEQRERMRPMIVLPGLRGDDNH